MARRPRSHPLSGLPREVRAKINKTKQTRGARPPDQVRYQNRVNRNGVAIVPYRFRHQLHPDGFADGGYRIEVKPQEYFAAAGIKRDNFDPAVVIGERAYIYYETRTEWNQYPPLEGWIPCPDRTGQGHYVARVPATTAAQGGQAIVRGKAQGIRFFEYASSSDLENSIYQLAWLAWHTEGIEEVTDQSMPPILEELVKHRDLADTRRLADIGAIVFVHGRPKTVCPLCLNPVHIRDLMTQLEQAEGREVADLTVTEANLFHLKDLKPGEYNHRPYLLGWGHHHCNIVARDRGVKWTVKWMAEVIRRHAYRVEEPETIVKAPD